MSWQSPPAHRTIIESDLGFVDNSWLGWFLDIAKLFTRGVTMPVPLAKITGPDSDGSLTLVNGVIVSVTQPT